MNNILAIKDEKRPAYVVCPSCGHKYYGFWAVKLETVTVECIAHSGCKETFTTKLRRREP